MNEWMNASAIANVRLCSDLNEVYRNFWSVSVQIAEWVRCADWKHSKKRKMLLDLLFHLRVFAHRVNLHTKRPKISCSISSIWICYAPKEDCNNFSLIYSVRVRIFFSLSLASSMTVRDDKKQSTHRSPMSHSKCQNRINGTVLFRYCRCSAVSRCMKDWMGFFSAEL